MKRMLLMLCILFIASGARALEKMRIAVLDFQANDVSIFTAKAVSEILSTEMARLGDVSVIERAQMGNILREQGLQQTGCTDSACAVQVGKLLSARKILIGTVSHLGRLYSITARVVDVESGSVNFAESERCMKEEDIDPASRVLAVKLVNRIAGKDYALPARSFTTEEPRKKFALQGGYRFGVQMTNQPILQRETIQNLKVSGSICHTPFFMLSYEFIPWLTPVGSLEATFVTIDSPDISTDKWTDSSGAVMETSPGGNEKAKKYMSYGAIIIKTFAGVILHKPSKGLSPYFRLELGYGRLISGNSVRLDYNQSNTAVNFMAYELTMINTNLFLGRAIAGLTVPISEYVELDLMLGIETTLGTPLFKGFKIRTRPEWSNNPDQIPEVYRSLDQTLRDEAARYRSIAFAPCINAGAGLTLRLF